MTTTQPQYKVTYTYINPGPGGPFCGSMTLGYKVARGVEIRAPFGRAEVRSCREVKEKAQ